MKNGAENNKNEGAKNKISRKMWTFLGLILTFFMLFFVLALLIMTDRYEKDYQIRESEIILYNTSNSIQNAIDSYKDISRMLMINQDVLAYLKSPNYDAGLRNAAKNGVLDQITITNNLDAVFIFRKDYDYMKCGPGNYYVYKPALVQPEWQNKLAEKQGGALILYNADGVVQRTDGAPVLTIARDINDINTLKYSGILLMNISMGMFNRVLQPYQNDNICIVATDGTYLAGNEDLVEFFRPEYNSKLMLHTDLSGPNSGSMISAYSIKDVPIIIMCRTDPAPIIFPIEIRVGFFILVLTFIFSLIFTGLFIIRNLSKPIEILSDAMEKTKESGWLEKVDIDIPNNEIAVLTDSYNSMIEYQQNLFDSIIEKEKTIQKAEVRVLYEQIKPHFLYNSLASIDYMALNAGATDVQKAIETLGNFYRNSLSKGSREIPLKREIMIVKDYIYLQRLRYGDIIVDEYDVEEEAEEMFVPKLILQPLVENSIYHGIRVKGEVCTIKITAAMTNDNLELSVYDTGIGITKEAINTALNDEEDKKMTEEKMSGFGLKETIKRIRHFCEKDDVVYINTEEGEYTEIKFVIPINKLIESEESSREEL